MTDYGPLDAAVSAIRGANPKIAAAFDEVEAILKTVAPPTPTPPSGPIDTSGQTNRTYANLSITLPPEYVNYNIAPVYLHDACTGIHAGPGLTLVGGFMGVKQYCSTFGATHDCTLDGMDISGVGGDLIHIDGAVNLHLDNLYLHDPVQASLHTPNPEHQDGIQIQAGDNIYIGPGVLIHWPVTPRLDYPNNGLFINAAGRPLTNVTVDRVRIHQWWGGRALQFNVSGKIISPDVVDCGNGVNSPPITCSAPANGGIIELHPAATGLWTNGVRRSDVYFNDYSGTGWPSYVRVF